MGPSDSKDQTTPQEIIRSVVRLCDDCDTCRPIMDKDCVFFPELYRLCDQEKQSGIPIAESELRRLVELCTLCGLCPCPDIPADVMKAKSRYIAQEGLPLTTRLQSNVPLTARLCSTFPRLVSALQSSKTVGPLLRKIMRIHPDRQFPVFPKQNFFQWAAKKGLTARKEGRRNVAYFAGCTAGYLFPQIGQAVVEVLERNNVTVYVPPQQCCGIPHFVEGDRKTTLQQVRSNIAHLLAAAQAGDDLICSCPTCGFFMKVLLNQKACYSEAYQKSVNAGEDELKVPETGCGMTKHRVLKKSMYKDLLKDDGYFAAVDPMARISLAAQLSDVGKYLAGLHVGGRFNAGFNAVPGRMVYFAPCHQREQKIGSPYPDLLALIPGLTVEPVGGTLDCCGMGGNFGFKAGFHEQSLAIGRSLMEKIKKKAPQAIITDCMSCRLQFSHALPYPVFHPIEILARAYAER